MIKVGVLGATGTVGQRFIQLLEDHPRFEISTLAASPRSAGLLYSKAVKWKLATQIPAIIKSLILKPCNPDHFQGVDLIFSGLDSDVAEEIELSFFKAGFKVFSNAKNWRMDPLVPLCVPLVNTNHMELIRHQQANFHGGSKGFLVTNANCSTTGLVVPLKALEESFGKISKCLVVTLQAISGAGYPGVPSLDIFDNVVPYIEGEEEKLESETNKILSSISPDKKTLQTNLLSTRKISATCTRVPVIDGHTLTVSLEFENQTKPTIPQIMASLKSYICDAQKLGCHSAPKTSVVVFDEVEEANRPQPRLDRDRELGMCVLVGRVRSCKVLDCKFTMLVHNTILGAAGSGILNAEVAVEMGLFE